MEYSAVLLFLLWSCNLCRAQWELEASATCEDVGPLDSLPRSVVRGWPVSLTCGVMVGNWAATLNVPPPDGEDLVVTCRMFINGILVHNTSGAIDGFDFTYKGDQHIILELNNQTDVILLMESGEFCGKVVVTLTPEEPSILYNGACKEARAGSLNTKYTLTVEQECDAPTLSLHCMRFSRSFTYKMFICAAESSDYPLVQGVPNQTVTWYRNCIEINSSEITSYNSGLPTSLSDIWITDPATFLSEFSCKVTYNGLTRFLWFQKVCMTAPKTNKKATLSSASQTVFAKPGDNVTLTCHGSGHVREGSSGSLRYIWERLEDSKHENKRRLCEANEFNQNSGNETHKYECRRKLHLNENSSSCIPSSETCFSFNRFSASLLIRNIKEVDFGKYTCVVRNDVGATNTTILLKRAEVPPPIKELTIALIVIAGLLTLMILFSIIIWIYFLEVQLLWKKYIAPCETQHSSYSAFLTYSFYQNREDKEAKELLKCLHEWFDAKNYSVFDEHRDRSGGYRYEMVENVTSQCHRMVVVVTPEFFEKDDKMFEVHTGVLNFINGKSRMIFIMAPEIHKTVLSNIKEKNSICPTINMAIKQKHNAVILWKGIHSRKRFFKQLDVAMPKLPPPAAVIENKSAAKDSEKLEKSCEESPNKNALPLV